MAVTPAGLDPLKPQVRHPRLALPNLIRCQTSLNFLICRAKFRELRACHHCSPSEDYSIMHPHNCTKARPTRGRSSVG